MNIVGNGTANGSKLQLWSCNGGANELWEITGGVGELYNPASGKCIDDPFNSEKNGTQLDIWACNSEPWQAWLLPGSPFESAVAGKCINDSGSSQRQRRGDRQLHLQRCWQREAPGRLGWPVRPCS